MAEPFNRNQFKGATLNGIKEEQARAEAAQPSNFGSATRPGFHTIEDGKNWRRIAPSHDPAEPVYRAKSTVGLMVEVPKVDKDGKETGEKEIKKKNIFIATQHSTTMTEDPILVYLQFVKQLADDIKDKDERTKFLSPVKGFRGVDKKWNWGIEPMLSYVCYCWDKKGILGRQELYAKMLDDMKKVSISRADENEAIVPDIFSDPDQGYPLIIDKYKDDKGKQIHDISCEMPNTKENWNEFFERTRITDEQLIDFLSKESLAELYKDVYTSRDWDLALDGLQRFDIANKYGIFGNPLFLDRLEVIFATVPTYVPKNERTEEDPKVDPVTAIKQHVAPTQKAAGTPVTQPTEASITPMAMRRFIKAYIAENYDADTVLPELSKEDVVKWYELAQNDQELPFDDYSNDGPTITGSSFNEPEKVVEESPVVDAGVINPELNNQINALRRKRNPSA